MAWEEDVIALLQTPGRGQASVGTYGSNMFVSTKAVLPAGTGPYLNMVVTSGKPPERTHNDQHTVSQKPSRQNPSAQLTVHAKDYAAARTMAWNAYYATTGRRNITVNGTFYEVIEPLQEPFDLGQDETGRARVAFNLMGKKNPS